MNYYINLKYAIKIITTSSYSYNNKYKFKGIRNIFYSNIVTNCNSYTITAVA